ncbi:MULTISPECIES: ABC transporter permease [Roseiflexus]|uniref:Monosaccharide-transporting ATPase n=1 Tax=Roseiflexus castenholzii (strain DSM 13941 / HLO8) TaxID=383372 RepID=A7NL31_ROSCS|nr:MULTISPECIES: ABC transporter permease [Roseiflexus]ABU58201.1 Monosaccharide-transporting ATPase [Roseiflexus castenholzii DSM 13941]GIW01127.1 MAG: sugar ABC transporter permease [Roseiflexus sp.]
MSNSQADSKAQRRGAWNSVGSSVFSAFRRSDASVVLAVLFLFALFSLSNPSFLTSFNLFNISRTAALFVFIALGQAIVIVAGGMNLSLGAIGGLTVVVAGWCMDTMGWSPWVGVSLALLTGMLCGMFNGFIVVKMRLNSFVVTLASLFIFTGLIQGISQGFPYSNIPKEFTILGRGDFIGIPYLLLLALVVLMVMEYVFKFRIVGRHLLATGGNPEAARLSGIRTDRVIFLSHTLSGLFAAIAGLLWVSRMGSAQPSTGADWLIISFAVAIIGGTALNGGAFSALGILASALLLTLIRNGLIMLNVNVYFEQTFLGLIVLLAVSIESIRQALNKHTNRSP